MDRKIIGAFLFDPNTRRAPQLLYYPSRIFIKRILHFIIVMSERFLYAVGFCLKNWYQVVCYNCNLIEPMYQCVSRFLNVIVNVGHC